MNIFKLDGTIYKITLNKGTSWRDTGADTVQRWNPEQEAWLDSDISASRVRSYGEPMPSVKVHNCFVRGDAVMSQITYGRKNIDLQCDLVTQKVTRFDGGPVDQLVIDSWVQTLRGLESRYFGLVAKAVA